MARQSAPIGAATDPLRPERDPPQPEGDPADSGRCAAPGDRGTDTVEAIFPHLDERFVCSPILAGDVGSFRVTGLRRDRCYHFSVLGVDASGKRLAVCRGLGDDRPAGPATTGCSCGLAGSRPGDGRDAGCATLAAIALLAAGSARRRGRPARPGPG